MQVLRSPSRKSAVAARVGMAWDSGCERSRRAASRGGNEFLDLALELLECKRLDDVIVASGIDAGFEIAVAEERGRGQGRDGLGFGMRAQQAGGFPGWQ